MRGSGSDKISRRGLLAGSAAWAAGSLAQRGLGAEFDVAGHPVLVNGFGELIFDQRRVLDLPRGFTYQIFSQAGEKMDDGLLVPSGHDGMASFPGRNGKAILLRNHFLIENTPGEQGPFGSGNALLSQLNRSLEYDAGRGDPPLSVVTTLVYDTQAQRLEKQFLSLAGVIRLSGGARTPWGSWVCCEQTTTKAGPRFEKDHGFNFEVAATETPIRGGTTPLKAMGRFKHEAAAFHPGSGIFYQTEDVDNGLLYRFIPEEPERLWRGGRLQALALRDMRGADTTNHRGPLIEPGRRMPVRWIDLDDVESPKADLHLRGRFQGAAFFTGLEGIAVHGDQVFFVSEDGGPGGWGQVWRYTVSRVEGTAAERDDPGHLELFVEPNNADLLQNPDSMTVSPWGDLILCEDGERRDHLVGVTPQGGLYQLARNAMNNSEFAGATFAPDGRTLFVNIKKPGLTLAITGPWVGSQTWTFHRARTTRRRR